jgi:hypothetical protein
MLVGGAVALLLVAMAAPVAAAPKSGCPATASGWAETSVGAATDRIWPGLLDPSAFPGGPSDLEAVIAAEDRNDDGDVCLLVMWGEALNPRSHWYRVGIEILGSPTEQFFVHDNTANAAGG